VYASRYLAIPLLFLWRKARQAKIVTLQCLKTKQSDMQKPIIIAFCGLAQSGKSTAMQAVRHFIHKNSPKAAVYTLNFADPLKEAYRAITGEFFLDVAEYKNAPSAMFEGLTNRQVIQKIGTDALRNSFDKRIWIRCLQKKIENLAITEHGHECYILIGDLRFANEADWVIGNNGIIVQIQRKGVVSDGHESEGTTLIPGYLIKNDGTLEELYEKINNLCWAVLMPEKKSVLPEMPDGTLDGFVRSWQDNFRILEKNRLDNLSLYLRLVNEEALEVLQEAGKVADGSSDLHLRQELLDLIWVALGAAISYGITKQQLREGFERLYLANGTKSTSDKAEADAYAEEVRGTVHECKDGYYFIVKDGKIQKGPRYRKA
jgi:NTP pyrophosphatase (non-canonical NTP hydrolase)